MKAWRISAPAGRNGPHRFARDSRDVIVKPPEKTVARAGVDSPKLSAALRAGGAPGPPLLVPTVTTKTRATLLRREPAILWPGPGSNRRPSAFQADARTN